MAELLGFQYQYVPVEGAKRTLLLLHGTGGDEQSLLDLGRFLDRTANLLSPRGKVLEGRASRFFRRLAEGVFDLDDLKVRTTELVAFIDEAAEVNRFDRREVVAVGFSNGANIAASIILSQPETLKAAILFAPMLPFTPAPDLVLPGNTVFMSAGRRDQIIPPAEAQALEDALSAHGAKLTSLWHDGGHELNEKAAIAARTWLADLQY